MTAVSATRPAAFRRRSWHREALPREDRAQRLLDLERERTAFYAEQRGGIQFDYDILSGSVTVVNRYEDPVNRTQKLDFDKGMGLTFLSGKDRRKLLDAIADATPEEPDAAFPVLIAVDQEYRLHRLVMHTMWSRAGVRHCVSVVGQSQMTMPPAGADAGRCEQRPAGSTAGTPEGHF